MPIDAIHAIQQPTLLKKSYNFDPVMTSQEPVAVTTYEPEAILPWQPSIDWSLLSTTAHSTLSLNRPYPTIFRLLPTTAPRSSISLGEWMAIRLEVVSEFGRFWSGMDPDHQFHLDEGQQFLPLECRLLGLSDTHAPESKLRLEKRELQSAAWHGMDTLPGLGIGPSGRGGLEICVVCSNGRKKFRGPISIEISAKGAGSMSVKPVVLGPITLSSETTETSSGCHIFRPFSLPSRDTRSSCSRLMLVKELWHNVPQDHIWDSAFGLVDMFAKSVSEGIRSATAPQFAGKRILDLSAGTGVTGIFVAGLAQLELEALQHSSTSPCLSYASATSSSLLSSSSATPSPSHPRSRIGSMATSVMLTDIAEAMDLIDTNIALNCCRIAPNVKVTAKELRWGKSHLNNLGMVKFDIVIASDVVYDRSSFGSLLETLSGLCTPERTTIYLGCKRRVQYRAAEDEFFQMIRKEFIVKMSTSDHGLHILRLTNPYVSIPPIGIILVAFVPPLTMFPLLCFSYRYLERFAAVSLTVQRSRTYIMLAGSGLCLLVAAHLMMVHMLGNGSNTPYNRINQSVISTTQPSLPPVNILGSSIAHTDVGDTVQAHPSLEPIDIPEYLRAVLQNSGPWSLPSIMKGQQDQPGGDTIEKHGPGSESNALASKRKRAIEDRPLFKSLVPSHLLDPSKMYELQDSHQEQDSQQRQGRDMTSKQTPLYVNQHGVQSVEDKSISDTPISAAVATSPPSSSAPHEGSQDELNSTPPILPPLDPLSTVLLHPPIPAPADPPLNPPSALLSSSSPNKDSIPSPAPNFSTFFHHHPNSTMDSSLYWILYIASQSFLMFLLVLLFLGVLILTEYVLDREDEDLAQLKYLYWSRVIGIAVATIVSATHGSFLSGYVLLDGVSDWIAKAAVCVICFYWLNMTWIMNYMTGPLPY
ncbi:Methyltransferase-like protein 21A [Haplosporangium sp. Z 11]|nr:Methyltransferase-like protein 21A [Haplosporangium sp. Z 11]